MVATNTGSPTGGGPATAGRRPEAGVNDVVEAAPAPMPAACGTPITLGEDCQQPSREWRVQVRRRSLPELAQPSIAVAVPAYNEEGIAGFLEDIDAALASYPRVSLHIVDDRSTSDMVERIRHISPRMSARVEVTTNERNLGHGPTVVAAYRRAIESGADYVLQVDGDGQFDPKELGRLVEGLRGGADAAVGVRRKRVDPWFRRTLSFFLRGYVRLLFGCRTRDANCPFRGYARAAIETLVTRLPPEPRVPNVYLTGLAHRTGLHIVEIEVTHLHRRGNSAQGTMWGRRARTILVPKRLLLFVAGAARESVPFALRARWRS